MKTARFHPYATVALILTVLAPIAFADKPNVLVIVADDMGWADVGYHGSPIPTPNIDRAGKAWNLTSITWRRCAHQRAWDS